MARECLSSEGEMHWYQFSGIWVMCVAVVEKVDQLQHEVVGKGSGSEVKKRCDEEKRRTEKV